MCASAFLPRAGFLGLWSGRGLPRAGAGPGAWPGGPAVGLWPAPGDAASRPHSTRAAASRFSLLASGPRAKRAPCRMQLWAKRAPCRMQLSAVGLRQPLLPTQPAPLGQLQPARRSLPQPAPCRMQLSALGHAQLSALGPALGLHHGLHPAPSAPCRMQLSLLAARAGGLLVCSAPAAVAVCALLCRLPAALVAYARGGSAAYEGAAAPTQARRAASLLAPLLAGAGGAGGSSRGAGAGAGARLRGERSSSPSGQAKTPAETLKTPAGQPKTPAGSRAGPNLRLAVRKIAGAAASTGFSRATAAGASRRPPAGSTAGSFQRARVGSTADRSMTSRGDREDRADRSMTAGASRRPCAALAVRIAGRTSGPAQARAGALSLSFAFHRVSDLSSLSSLARLGLASLSLSLFT